MDRHAIDTDTVCAIADGECAVEPMVAVDPEGFVDIRPKVGRSYDRRVQSHWVTATAVEGVDVYDQVFGREVRIVGPAVDTYFAGASFEFFKVCYCIAV